MFTKSKVLKIVFALLSIITISYFASIRADEIGTDILVYVKPYLDYTRIYGLKWIINNSECEVLYLVLNQVIIWFGGDLKTLLFIITFFISSMFYLYANNSKKETDLCITYSVYLFVFLGISFNLVRQSIATAVVMYSLKFIKEDNFKKFLITILIASGFHISAIIMLPLFFLYKFFGTKIELAVKIIVTIISIIVVFCAEYFMKFLYLLSNKFDSEYLNRYFYNGWSFNTTWELLKLFIFVVLMLILRYNKKDKNNKYNKKYFDFCKFLLVLDLIFFQFGAIYRYAERFSYYFMIISYSYLIPCLLDIFKQKKDEKPRILPTIIILILLFVYFYIVFVLLRISAIVPYNTR